MIDSYIFAIRILKYRVTKYQPIHGTLALAISNSIVSNKVYGTEYEIWDDFGPVGNTEKNVLGRLGATFESSFFMFSGAKIR